MFCPKCGTKVADDSTFCHNCGASMSGAIAPPTAESPETGVDQSEATPPAPATPSPTPSPASGTQAAPVPVAGPGAVPVAYQVSAGPCLACARPAGGEGRFCRWCGQLLVGERGVRVASFGKRLLGYLLEGLLIILTLGIGYIIWTLFFAWPKGQSPAKQLLGMRVVKADGTAASWWTMFLREIIARPLLATVGALVLVVGTVIPTLWMIWDRDSQTLYDKLAGTFVVDDREARELAQFAEGAAEQ